MSSSGVPEKISMFVSFDLNHGFERSASVQLTLGDPMSNYSVHLAQYHASEYAAG